MRESIKKRNNRIIAGLLVVVTMMTVVYAAFATKLNISSTSKIDNIWNIQITNIEAKNIVGTASSESSSHTDLTANFETKLISPGDSITYEVTVKNNGGIDAELNEVKKTYTNSSYISVTYKDLVKGQMLYKGESAVMKVEVTFIDKDYEKFTESITSDISITLDFVQKGNNVDPTKKYLVTYDTQGGTYVESRYVEWDEHNLVNVPSPKMTGYGLIGWYTQPDGRGRIVGNATSLSSLLDDENAEGITLYAGWSVRSFTINYDTQGADSIASKSLQWTAKVVTTTPSREGYEFLGWYTKPNGGGNKITNSTYVSEILNGKEPEDEQNYTLYAYWKEKSYTLAFSYGSYGRRDVVGNLPSSKTVKWTDKNLINVSPPTREGYTFVSWNTLSNGKGNTVTNDLSAEEFKGTYSEKITIYAIWEKNE